MYLMHWPDTDWQPSVWEVQVIGKVHGTLLDPFLRDMEELPHCVIFQRLVWSAQGKNQPTPTVDVPFLHKAQFYDQLSDAFARIKELKAMYVIQAAKEEEAAFAAFQKASKRLTDTQRDKDSLRDIELPLQV